MIDEINVNMELPAIQETIFELPGQKIMLDLDLTRLYEVPTKSLNLAVKRNSKGFRSILSSGLLERSLTV